MSLRIEARQREVMFSKELSRAVGDNLGVKLKAPPPLERRAQRFGGGYVSKGAEDYDWFYGLSRAEQKRLRENWMTHSSAAPTPSEIEEHIPIRKWLDLTRGVDMSRAITNGRHINEDRYGGMRPESLIVGEPYDLDEIHHRDRDRRARHWRAAKDAGDLGRNKPVNPRNVRRGISYKADGTLDVQFFTDDEGVVHPIRASYDEGDTGPKVEHRDYDPAF